MKKLSKNLSLAEVLISQTAKRLDINNEPTDQHLENLKDIAVSIFQPLREALGAPIYVSSGYRSKQLNKAIKGSSKTSQHMKGEALDLDADVYGVITNAQIFHYIKDNLVFDQIVWEYGDEKNPGWVHVSFCRGNNRNKALRCIRVNGSPSYSIF